MNNPLISVIIPTFNRATFLEKCLLSIKNVILNDYFNIQVVVVDGGSTDGTAHVIEKFAAENILFISEKDHGAAEAINKGIRIAHGQIIRYFSDDDEMLSGETKTIVEYFSDHPDIEVVGGQAIYFKDDGAHPIVQIFPELAVGEISQKNFAQGNTSITHESLFFRKKLFEQLGGYDDSLKFCFDVEMIWRIVTSGRKIVITEKMLTKRILQPESNSQVHQKENFREFARIYFKYHAWNNLFKLIWYEKVKRKTEFPAVRIRKFVSRWFTQ